MRSPHMGGVAGAAALALLSLAVRVDSALAQAPARSEHDYQVTRWTVEDGLPLDHINDLAVGPDGFLWISTFDGLARFDGRHFEIFRSADTPALPNNRIRRLEFDAFGALWLLTEAGDVVRHHAGAFERIDGESGLRGGGRRLFRDDDTLWLADDVSPWHIGPDGLEDALPGQVPGLIGGVGTDRDGTVWVSATLQPRASVLLSYAPDGSTVRRDEGDGIPPQGIGPFHRTDDDELWVSAHTAAARLDGARLEMPASVARVLTDPVLHLRDDASGALWIVTGNRTIRYADGAAEIVSRGGATAGPASIARSPDGAVWYTDDRYLYRSGVEILEIDRATGLRFDAAGNLWVGGGEGLLRVRRADLRTIGVAEGLEGQNVTTIGEDPEGAIWIGSWDGGMVRLSPRGLDSVPLPPDHAIPGISGFGFGPDGLPWMSTLALVCRVVDLRCEPVMGPDGVPLQGHHRAITIDLEGRVWLGGGPDGLVVGTPTPEHGLRWRRVGSEVGDLGEQRVQAITVTRDGEILLATMGGGIWRWADGSPEVLTTADGLASNTVRDIYEDDAGMLWVATEDAGLCRLDRSAAGSPEAAGWFGTVSCLDVDRGLYDNSLHMVLEDDAGRLWMNSNRGISWALKEDVHAVLDGRRRALTPIGYDESDGMRNREGNGGRQPSGIRGRDGRLWFATQAGAVVIDPATIPATGAPPVVIDRIGVAGAADGGLDRFRNSAGLSRDTTFRLETERRDVEIQWTAIAMTHADDVRFRYRMVGYDGDWREAGTETQAVYTNLPAGDLEFQVEAGLGGAWSTEPARLALYRQPAFTETGWALALAVLTIVALAAGVQSYRSRQLVERQRVLEVTVAERTSELADKNVELESKNEEISAQAERLAELDELKSQFIANVSHELRTPLTLIKGPLAELQADRANAEPREARRLELMQRNADQLHTLIEELLDVSRLEAGAIRLAARPVDLGAFVAAIARRFAPEAERRGIGYEIELPSSPIVVYLDHAMMIKVVSNLIGNALKFTPKGCRVAVGVREVGGGDPGFAAIEVEDTGIGIRPRDLDRVFDRFYQADRGDDRTSEGTGIGLALARELAELHGGTIDVQSAFGSGSTFRVLLPLGAHHLGPDEIDLAGGPPGELPELTGVAITDGEPAVAEPTLALPRPIDDRASVAGDQDDRRTLLLVEDNPDMRQYLADHLHAYYRVVEASDGESAWSTLETTRPDIVLSDVMMPGVDGLELCRRMRQSARHREIPIVLVSAKATEKARVVGLAIADDYVTKPFSMPELRARLARLASRVRGHAVDEASVAEAAGLAERAERSARENLANPDFGVAALAKEVAMSQRNLSRRLVAECGETPRDLLRRVRMTVGKDLLSSGGHDTVAEVAAAVGLSRSYFQRLYAAWFGNPPAQDLG